jgi:Tfp pilus assembly protein PilV
MRTPLKKDICPQCRTCGGFTLLEVMVASVIVVISIAAVVAMVRKGQELTSDDGHRRIARSLITTKLESSTYDYTNYGNLADTSITDSVIIDTRGTATTADDIKGVRTITVANEQTIAGTAGITVPYKLLTFRVIWREPEGMDTVQIQKQIAQAL